jgi:signal transduction histidine kinase
MRLEGKVALITAASEGLGFACAMRLAKAGCRIAICGRRPDVLLNLISNGFYAATKRIAKIGFDEYEPTLSVATKNLGNSVEITIRDNGGGIPPEVREKMFNPFFTTKPPGEGTGLGLSLTYDIVVKQHLGSIEVDTQPGEFTEFKVILPR